MTETSPSDKISTYKKVLYSFSKINTFKEKESLSLTDQLFATQIFIIFFAIALITLILFTSLNLRTQTITIYSPSQMIVEKLSHQYPNTLSCPCSQTSIRQDQFLSFHPQYHSICDSYLINQTFISSLSDPYMSAYYPADFRLLAASYFQSLALLCRTAKQSVQDAILKYGKAQIITNRVLSIDAFNTQINALVKQLQTTTVADIKQLSHFLSLIVTQNRIFSALRTNYFIHVNLNTPKTSYTFNTFIFGYLTMNGFCSCSDNNLCISQAGLYNTTVKPEMISNIKLVTKDVALGLLIFTLPGIMAGCMPYQSLLQSTLQCFHNQSCLNQITIYLDRLSNVSPLSSSSSRFQQNTTINDLFDELFIESWNNKSNFSGYFHACDPHSCTYSYDQQFNLLYTFVTFISFLGGLKLLLYLLSPLIAKLIRRIQKIKCCYCCWKKNQETTTMNEEEEQQSLKDRLLTKIHKLYRRLMTLNLFPTSSTIEDGVYSTRVFLLLLIIGILFLVFYASMSVRVHSVTIYHPSIDQFEQLNDQYSSTLVCPCTQLSVSYSSIIHIKPTYHQVCSSDFVNVSSWFSYFENLGIGFNRVDFRLTGSGLFNLLGILCNMSNETVMNELTVFNGMQFVSARALTRSTFDAQTSQLIHQFEQQTTASFLGLFELVQALVQLNQFIVRGYSNAVYHVVYDRGQSIVVFSSQIVWTDTCSCGTNNSCTFPQGFYCKDTKCGGSRKSLIEQRIPGLVLSCLQVDSLLLSTFECFYNLSCIQMLIQWRSFDFSNLRGTAWSNIVPLDPMIKSRFPPNTRFETIVSQLFIEDWINSTNFISYYNQCLPNECTYSFVQGYNTIYVLTTVFGLIGGLSVVLRIFIPPIIQLIRRLYLCRRRQNQQTTNEISEGSGIHHRIFIFGTYIRHSIVTMNIYKKATKTQTEESQPTSTERKLIHNQQIATRIYFLLFICSLFIILLFTGLDRELNSITIPSPSESTFEQLQSEYSSTLSCPCSQVAIQYSKVLSLIPSSYHQICSSRFISFDFITQLWGSELHKSYYTQLDLKLLSTYFRLLSSLCSLAKNEIDTKIQMFNLNEFISIETLTQNSFQSQVDSIIQTFIDQASAIFRRRSKYMIDTFHANQLHTMFLTNWNILLPNVSQTAYLPTSPVVYGECSCATSSTCSRQLVFGLNARNLTLPGLVAGCLPVHGLRLSTLECFHNLSCVTELFLVANISNNSYPILNTSFPTRFIPVSSTLIGTLIDELFIESWKSSSNYSTYYSTCAPSTCRYTYVKKNDVIYMLTTFLGLYGGLTIGIKFIVWYGLCIYRKLCRCVAIHSHVVEPINES